VRGAEHAGGQPLAVGTELEHGQEQVHLVVSVGLDPEVGLDEPGDLGVLGEGDVEVGLAAVRIVGGAGAGGTGSVPQLAGRGVQVELGVLGAGDREVVLGPAGLGVVTRRRP